MNRRILFVLKDFPIGAGVERVTLNLAKQFSDDGNTVSFFITSELSSEEIQLLDDFPVMTISTGLLGRVKALNHYIRTKNIDVVIGAKEQANMIVWLVSLINRHFKPILTRHCAFDVSDQLLSVRKLVLLYNLYAFFGAKLVAVSTVLRDYIKKRVIFGKRNIVYCPNPVVSPNISDMASIPLDETISSKVPYFCSVGRLCEQKGFDLLLSAYKKALNNKPDLPSLVIVGTGPDIDSLNEQIKCLKLEDRVVLTGFNNNPYNIMRSSDGFILSSRHEGLPTVLIEAMSLGIPVTSFDCPTGPKEILKNGQLGYLVKAGNIDELAEKIVSLKNSPIAYSKESVIEYRYQKAAEEYYKVFS